MELKPRERKEIDLEFIDEESSIHVKVQEVKSRGENKEDWFSVNVHIECDTYWNAFDLACPSEEQAKEVAEKSFEFFKSIKPLLSVKIKDPNDSSFHGSEVACQY